MHATCLARLIVHVHVDGVRRCLWTAATNRPIVHPPGDMVIYEYGVTVEWYWQGKAEDLEEKSVPAPLCLPKIPFELTRVRTRATPVRGLHLTAWAMARPSALHPFNIIAIKLSGEHKLYMFLQSPVTLSLSLRTYILLSLSQIVIFNLRDQVPHPQKVIL
jgi:hypothetical protein